jgi:glycerol-3-phosphate O-acyltransferase/dihydroxyacetone phosphate acyltransferase
MPPRRSAPLLYRLSRVVVRLGVHIFYRRVVVHTLEHVPPRGPVIFAATHPNSVTDALVLGASIPRPIRYVAHSGLFRNPIRGWLLRRARVIPVFRPEDFAEPVDNRVMFHRSTEALVDGGAIGIFPEGTSHQEERVLKLRTGTARIALEAESASDFSLGVQIVPVGLNFESPGRFRSDVLVLLGPPLVLHPFQRLYRLDPVRAVQEVTQEIKERLERLVLELPAPDFLPLVRDTLRLLRDTHGDDAGQSLVRHHYAARDVGAALSWAAKERPLEYARFARSLRQHARKRRRLGVPEAELRAVPRKAEVTKPVMMAGLPLALAGAAAHALPYRLTAWATRTLDPHPTKVAMIKFSAGAFFFFLWYALIAGAAWLLWGRPWIAVLTVFLLALTGWTTLSYLPLLTSAWPAIRTGFLGRPKALLVERLRAERQALAGSARELWAAFHAVHTDW